MRIQVSHTGRTWSLTVDDREVEIANQFGPVIDAMCAFGPTDQEGENGRSAIDLLLLAVAVDATENEAREAFADRDKKGQP